MQNLLKQFLQIVSKHKVSQIFWYSLQHFQIITKFETCYLMKKKNSNSKRVPNELSEKNFNFLINITESKNAFITEIFFRKIKGKILMIFWQNAQENILPQVLISTWYENYSKLHA